MQDVFFLTDAQWNDVPNKNYDYIVIGTGFCALAFASKMLEAKPDAKILLLERGGFFLPAHFQTLPKAFAETLGGVSETFPWTLDHETAAGRRGEAKFCHGSVPFFGGRSTVWSTW
jgi:choline dehydrogenase-like flavoprotein